MRPFLSEQLQPLNGPQRGCMSFGMGEVRGINPQRREVTAILSAPTIDAYGEIVEPEAVMKRLARFKKNPVLLANHCYTADNGASGIVGKWLEIGIQKVPGVGKCVVGTCRFMEADALAESWWQRFKQGMAVAFSIGFILRGWEMRDEKVEGRTQRVRVFTDIELLEVSCVSVPACADAVVLAASLGGVGRGVPAAALQPDADMGELLGPSGGLVDDSGDNSLSGAGAGAYGGGRRMDKALSRSIGGIVESELRKRLNTDPGGYLWNMMQEVAEHVALKMRPSVPVASTKQSRRVVTHAPSAPSPDYGDGLDELLDAPRAVRAGKPGGDDPYEALFADDAELNEIAGIV